MTILSGLSLRLNLNPGKVCSADDDHDSDSHLHIIDGNYDLNDVAAAANDDDNDDDDHDDNDEHLQHFIRAWLNSRNKVGRAESNLLHLVMMMMVIRWRILMMMTIAMIAMMVMMIMIIAGLKAICSTWS